MKNLEIPVKILFEWFIPVDIFWKKGPKVLPLFPAFTETTEIFCAICRKIFIEISVELVSAHNFIL